MTYINESDLCDGIRIDLGAYVLGALSEAEAARVEEHLPTCPDCLAELAAFADLPPALDLVDPGDVDAPLGAAHTPAEPATPAPTRHPPTAHPPTAPVPGVAGDPAAVARHRHGSRRAGWRRAGARRPASPRPGSRRSGSGRPGPARPVSERPGSERPGSGRPGSTWAGSDRAGSPGSGSRRPRRRRLALFAGGAALLVALVAGLFVGGVGSSGGPAGNKIVASGASTGVRATVWVDAQAEGTAFTLRLSGVRPYERCALVVRGRDGTGRTAAWWRASYEGHVDVHARTDVRRDQIASLEVVADDGHELVSLPLRS